MVNLNIQSNGGVCGHIFILPVCEKMRVTYLIGNFSYNYNRCYCKGNKT